jgi:hypothetical protein
MSHTDLGQLDLAAPYVGAESAGARAQVPGSYRYGLGSGGPLAPRARSIARSLIGAAMSVALGRILTAFRCPLASSGGCAWLAAGRRNQEPVAGR